LLGEDAGPEKRPKRTRSVAGSNAKRTSARRSGGKRPTKSNDQAASAAGQLLKKVNEEMPLNETTSRTLDSSARSDAVQPAGNEVAHSEVKSVADDQVNGSPAINEVREATTGENGRHRAHGEVTVEQPRPEPVYGEGLIEVSGKGFGFLRDPKRNYVQSPQDIFVTPEVVRKHALRDGLWIKGEIRRGSRGPQLFKLTEINGEDPDRYRNLPVFEELTSINPVERIRLETVPDRYTTRVMDLMTPIGKGQRGLIVAPPRTGKTTLLQHIADAVVRNHPETSLIILLVDERP
jgi:transcription termination factor Rho